LRGENAKTRTTAKDQAAAEARQAILDEVSRTLGLSKGDEKLTAEQLTAKLAENDQEKAKARDEARQAQVELGVFRVAAVSGADANALLDSRTFLAKVAPLDPSADDFRTKVQEAITAAVQENPRLAASTAPAKGGTEFRGGPGNQNQRATSLEEATANLYRT
jgi:hypothetical protein